MLAMAEMVDIYLEARGEEETPTSRLRAGQAIRSAFRRGAVKGVKGKTGRWNASPSVFKAWAADEKVHFGGRPRKDDNIAS